MSSREPEAAVIASDFLFGERVVDSRGKDLGKIEDIMFEPASGRIRYAVVSFGGIFGLGERLFALPWKVLRPDLENRRFILAMDRERLKNAPGFDRHSWPSMGDLAWGRDIYRFYAQTPYWEHPGSGGEPPDARPERTE